MVPVSAGSKFEQKYKKLKAKKTEQGIKKSHNCKCDKTIVFYDRPKRPAQGARKLEIHVFVGDFVTPRTSKVTLVCLTSIFATDFAISHVHSVGPNWLFSIEQRRAIGMFSTALYRSGLQNHAPHVGRDHFFKK